MTHSNPRAASWQFIFAVLALCSLQSISQNKLEGKIADDKQQGISYCNVGLLNAKDSSVAKGTIANDNGEFFFENIAKGSYIIKATFVGYDEFLSQAIPVDSNSQLKLEAITLNSKAVNLKEVSVVAVKKTVEFKDGMIVVNVEDSPLASGNTVFDLLKRLPGVTIDANNTIFLNGKQDVRIMIDGRIQRLSGQQLVSVLMSMSSENIQKVEVMNSPPVKYDADGAGGMLNIVTKKIKIVGWSGDIRAGSSKGTVWRSGSDGSLNYKGKNFAVFSNVSYSHRDFYHPYVFDKVVTLDTNKTYLNENGETTEYVRSIYFRVGTDIYLSSKTTLGLFVNGGPGSTPNWDRGINRVMGYNDLGFQYTLFDVRTTDNWDNYSYNVNLEHKIDSLGSFISYAGDYSTFGGHSRQFSDNAFYDANGVISMPYNRYISEHQTGTNIHTEKVDYKKVLKKQFQIETGVKATFVNNSNQYSLSRQDYVTLAFVEDSLISNNYRYNENIFAGYFSTRKSFEKFALQIGARAENTISDGKDLNSNFKITRNYWNVFPNFSIERNSRSNSLQFRIDSRIFRPGYKELSPFKSYNDNYSSNIGNPKLVAQQNYNFSVTHGYKQMLFTTIMYVRAQNFMLHYDFQNDTTKETSSTNANLKGNNHHIWMNMYFQKDLFKWWNTSISTYCGRMHFDGELIGGTLNRSVFDWSAFMNNDITLPQQFKLQVTGNYHSKSAYGVFYSRATWSLDIGIRKQFFKKSLTVTLTAFDIFYTNVEDLRGVNQNLNLRFRNPGDTRRVWMQIGYRFGKVRAQKRETSGNEDEKSRMEKKG